MDTRFANPSMSQIQKKWHWDRMERLGVTDLMGPSGNFRVGCDFLAELYAKYNGRVFHLNNGSVIFGYDYWFSCIGISHDHHRGDQ